MFSCNVVSRWAQLVTFLNCFQDIKLSRIAIYRDEFRRMNCNLNWSLISCEELHCDSVKIKTMINSLLFFIRQCASLDWSGCFVVVGYSFPEERSRVFSSRRFLFSLPAPYSAPFDSPHFLLSSGSFNMALSRANCALKESACTAG